MPQDNRRAPLARRVTQGESCEPRCLDASWECVYIRIVAVRKVQVGQVWKKDDSGDAFLITKMYSEALTSYAVLRKAGAENEPPLRVKIHHTGSGAELPGFTFTQDSDKF
jgi:hypothetical protein